MLPRTMASGLLLTLILFLSGCRDPGASDSSADASEGHASGLNLTMPAPTTEEPSTEPWVPAAEEVLLDAKILAAEIARDLATYPPGTDVQDKARSMPAPANQDALAELLRAGATASARVLYPQLVGVSAEGAAVTVLVEQALRSDEGEAIQRRVLDFRLERGADGWRFAELRSGGGSAFPPPQDQGLVAREVLDHPRIHLPDTGRWDIHRGEVSEDLLRLLLRIAERHEIHVLTLVGGRPGLVFGTDRPSRHAAGRAVDIFKIDGLPVIEQRWEGSPAHRLVTWLFEIGTPEIGSPWALDGFGGRSFTDLVHQDHIHVGVDP